MKGTRRKNAVKKPISVGNKTNENMIRSDGKTVAQAKPISSLPLKNIHNAVQAKIRLTVIGIANALAKTVSK